MDLKVDTLGITLEKSDAAQASQAAEAIVAQFSHRVGPSTDLMEIAAAERRRFLMIPSKARYDPYDRTPKTFTRVV